MPPPWVVWTGFGFTVVGALLTAVAFYFTFREAREAKRAAEAATTAANQAKEAISQKVTIADLAAIRNSFLTIVRLLDAQKPEVALQEVQTVRQRVNELRERPTWVAGRPRDCRAAEQQDFAGAGAPGILRPPRRAC